MQKAKFWINAKVNVIDITQVFYYMSCIGCNKGTGYKYNESFVCMYCKNQGVCKPRYESYNFILKLMSDLIHNLKLFKFKLIY